MNKIFISYKRENAEQVYRLVDSINQEVGQECWIDIDGIESSAQFMSKICEAIDNADIMLFMHSSIHLHIDFDEDWTVRELHYAQAKKKRVILVKLDNAPLEKVFLMLFGTKNNIDSWDEKQWKILLRDLKKHFDMETDDLDNDTCIQELDKTQPIPNNPIVINENTINDRINRIKRIHELLKDSDENVIKLINNDIKDNEPEGDSSGIDSQENFFLHRNDGYIGNYLWSDCVD